MAPSSLVTVIADMVPPDAEAALFGSLFEVGMMILAGMERTEPKSLDRSVVLDLQAKLYLAIYASCKNCIPCSLACPIQRKILLYHCAVK